MHSISQFIPLCEDAVKMKLNIFKLWRMKLVGLNHSVGRQHEGFVVYSNRDVNFVLGGGLKDF